MTGENQNRGQMVKKKVTRPRMVFSNRVQFRKAATTLLFLCFNNLLFGIEVKGANGNCAEHVIVNYTAPSANDDR